MSSFGTSAFDLLEIFLMIALFLSWLLYITFPLFVTWLLMLVVDGATWIIGWEFQLIILEWFAYGYVAIIMMTTVYIVFTSKARHRK